MSDRPFWKTKPLVQLTHQEWESLCDGCGKCCVLKLEDMDTGAVYYTDVACKMLDCQTGKCRDYDNRKLHVPDCVLLTPQSVEQLAWMPKTCAYRLVYEGHDLPIGTRWYPGPAIPSDRPDNAWLAASFQKAVLKMMIWQTI